MSNIYFSYVSLYNQIFITQKNNKFIYYTLH